MRQGFGRLIGGRDEYGVVAILDTRLVSRSYDRTIVSLLPEMNVVHSVEDVKTFFDSIPATKAQIAKQQIDSANIRGVGIT